MANPTAVAETERKYEADPSADLGTAIGADHGTPERQHLRAVYYDTPDLRLLGARITLRRREGGHDAGWHLKLPADGDTRLELRLPLDQAPTVDDARTTGDGEAPTAGTGGSPPDELRALTRVHTRGRPLGPVARLDTHRKRWVLTDDRGRERAELTEDDVDARTLGALEPRTVSWREYEVELGERGSAKLLDRIERTLLERGARRSDSRSKVGRLLGPDTLRERRKLSKPGSAGAVLLDYLQAQADRLRELDAGVRRDQPDAVHQMRVTSRRMRSALQAYRRVLDRSRTSALVEELRWLGRELDGARDAEVIEERLLGALAELPDDLILGPVPAQVTRALQRRRADGQERALTALDGDRYLRLHDLIDELLTDPPLTRQARRPARTELPKAVGKAWRRLERHHTVLAGATGAERDEALHDTRKSAKRLRYAVEVAEPALGKPATRFRKRLKRLNSLLGDHQDTVVARPVIRELAATAAGEGGNGFTHGLLYGREELEARDTEAALPGLWADLARRRNRRWFE